RDLLARVDDSMRLQVLHTVDYRKALANAASPDERRHGRDLSRAISHDVPVARDLAGNLLDTVDRLSSARDPATPSPSAGSPSSPVASGSDTPAAPPPLPASGAPSSLAPPSSAAPLPTPKHVGP
ncbi:MAG TPA: hypothetical protein VN853_11500, partial [Polyangia bacterium]|nr:hypothetical protein [Polyangia bacterium]